MSKPLDERYLTWLYGQVGSVKEKNPSLTYWKLVKKLFTKEFIWLIPNDDNRAEDGRDLRQEFLAQRRVTEVDDTWLRLGCSVLEMLIALSRRLSFQAEGEPAGWFWLLIENLNLERYNDNVLNHEDSNEILDEVLDQLVWRTYASDGRGGLFPLKEAQEDQREVEIWYQMSAYLLERQD